MEKGSDYQTFDSGSGPVIPEKDKGSYDHNDDGSAPEKPGTGSCEVPQVPSK